MIARVKGVLLLLQSLLLLLLQLLRVDRCYRRVTSFLLLAVLVVGVAKLQRHLECHLLGWHQVHGRSALHTRLMLQFLHVEHHSFSGSLLSHRHS